MKPGENGFYHIALCLIEIWEPSDPLNLGAGPGASDTPMLITEVGDIEICDNYQKLIVSASVKFPRGTVIRGVPLTGGEDTRRVTASLTSQGVLSETRRGSKLAAPTDFKMDSRIRIYLGYATPDRLDLLEMSSPGSKGRTIWTDREALEEYRRNLSLMFDGFIRKVGLESPVELSCEDLMSNLKLVSCPNAKLKRVKVSDLFKPKASGGRWGLLDGTGLSMHPDSANVMIGAIDMSPDETVADLLSQWNRCKVFAFLDRDNSGKPCVKVGRTYFSNPGKDCFHRRGIAKTRGNEKSPGVPTIDFSYNVAENGLSLVSAQKKYLAVEATAFSDSGSVIHLTILRDPSWDGKSDDPRKKYRVLNESSYTKKQMKKGLRPISGSPRDKVRKDLYTKVSYVSPNMFTAPGGGSAGFESVNPYSGRAGDYEDPDIPQEDDEDAYREQMEMQQIAFEKAHAKLQEEAIKFFESYDMNGIEGNIEVFGDFPLVSGQKVRLEDELYPAKNGYYLTGEVTTAFGTGGYRQTVKFPYCMGRDSGNDNENAQQS